MEYHVIQISVDPPAGFQHNLLTVMDGEKLVGLLTSENVSSFILLRQVYSMQQQAKAQSRSGANQIFSRPSGYTALRPVNK